MAEIRPTTVGNTLKDIVIVNSQLTVSINDRVVRNPACFNVDFSSLHDDSAEENQESADYCVAGVNISGLGNVDNESMVLKLDNRYTLTKRIAAGNYTDASIVQALSRELYPHIFVQQKQQQGGHSILEFIAVQDTTLALSTRFAQQLGLYHENGSDEVEGSTYSLNFRTREKKTATFPVNVGLYLTVLYLVKVTWRGNQRSRHSLLGQVFPPANYFLARPNALLPCVVMASPLELIRFKVTPGETVEFQLLDNTFEVVKTFLPMVGGSQLVLSRFH